MSLTEKEKMLRGELYMSDDPELVELRRLARSRMRAFNNSDPEDTLAREKAMTALLGRHGSSCYIEPPFFCDYGTNIFLGNNVYMNFNCVALDCNKIEIGNNVMFGPNVSLYPATHPTDPALRNAGPEYAKAIKIGDGVWIGGGATILPGITIGEGSTIGAGSVVTKDVPSYVVVAGNPARVIRQLAGVPCLPRP
eukprot:CAMPEP_0184648246 /NCGR_PEP_ID=MMETSP0308-20130426/5321_1 /TAXON_ID=38269 /ORGANISM="Gloeochaete witrockiana, Strain SAG 46.84" /LENGTH=194 /DNA_ID=CAMNT_0027079909 /DNA_START=54 /DNA_END=638 /DNA_ORIENTATION=+